MATTQARFEQMKDINAAQRAEVCTRYTSLQQYAHHLAHTGRQQQHQAVSCDPSLVTIYKT